MPSWPLREFTSKSFEEWLDGFHDMTVEADWRQVQRRLLRRMLVAGGLVALAVYLPLLSILIL